VLGGKTCPNTNFSTINPISTGVGRNLGLHGERPATYRENYGTVSWNVTPCVFVDIYQAFGGICCCFYHGTVSLVARASTEICINLRNYTA
jgi:hypothetical protein